MSNTGLKDFYSRRLDRHIPGANSVAGLLEMKDSPMGRDMAIRELQALWLIMDSRSSNPKSVRYRDLYADALRTLGSKTPRAATVSARPITRDEFNAVTGTEEDS